MTIANPITIVRRPISLKIFGIAVGLLVMMIFVTLYSSRYLSQVSEQLELLKTSYIELDQRMGNIRADSLSEVAQIERVLHYKPKVADGSAAAAAAFYKEAGNCELEFLRPVNAKIRAAYPLRGEQQLMMYRVRRLCTQAKLQSAESIVDKTLANPVVRSDPDQVARFSSIKADLQNIPQSREKLNEYFEKYLSQLDRADEAALAVAQEQIDERRGDVIRRIGAVTRTLQKGTRESADATEALAGKTKRISWVVTGVACVFGLLVAFFITRNLVAPVRELLGLTNSIRSGNLDVHIQIKTGDEIGMLADSFNHMVGEMRQKEQITSMFGKYVDPRIVKGLLLDEESFKQGGERQCMSVFFSDLQGFTTASEALTPTGVVRLLNQYFSLMAEPIRAHQGIIDKYIGDSVMAFWGPPFSSPHEHAAQACFAALDQQARVPQFQALLPEVLGIRKNVPVIRVRMGIATGDVTVGSIGSEEARSYTVIGDNVNLASRLEGANKHYHTQILISEETKKLAGDLIETREVDSIRVVGKTDPVRIYELLARKGNISAQIASLRDQYERGLQLYRGRNMPEASAAFAKCLDIFPDDGPAKLFLQRLESFKGQVLTENWDGVWTMTEK
ncbi:MAG: adenylate/guanylate cyclase domain-containing protein [Betaproteobacteria bacterium]